MEIIEKGKFWICLTKLLKNCWCFRPHVNLERSMQIDNHRNHANVSMWLKFLPVIKSWFWDCGYQIQKKSKPAMIFYQVKSLVLVICYKSASHKLDRICLQLLFDKFASFRIKNVINSFLLSQVQFWTHGGERYTTVRLKLI